MASFRWTVLLGWVMELESLELFLLLALSWLQRGPRLERWENAMLWFLMFPHAYMVLSGLVQTSLRGSGTGNDTIRYQ